MSSLGNLLKEENSFANSIPQSEMARNWGLMTMFVLSLPVEVMLRRNFGVRYFQNFFVLCAFVLLVLLNFAGEIAGTVGGAARQIRGQDQAEETPAAEESETPGEEPPAAAAEEPGEVDETPLTGFFASLFLLLSIGHRINGFIRQWRGIRWHSYNSGESWLARGPLSEEIVQLYLEPVFVIIVSMMIRPIDGTLGAFLFFSGIALGIKEHWRAHIMRDKFLNVIDAQLASQYLQAAVVEERPSRETEGFKVIGAVPLRTRRERERLVELGGALDAVGGSAQALPGVPWKPPPLPDLDRTHRG